MLIIWKINLNQYYYYYSISIFFVSMSKINSLKMHHICIYIYPVYGNACGRTRRVSKIGRSYNTIKVTRNGGTEKNMGEKRERERDRARYRDKETRDLVVRFEPTISVCVGILLFRGVGFEIHDRSLSIDWYHACFCFFRPRFSLIPLLLHVFFLCQKDYFFFWDF